MATIVVRISKTYILLFFAFWCSANEGLSQDVDRKVSVSFVDEPLSKVLEYLTEHESLQFSYSKEQISLDSKILLTSDDVTVKELLSKICEQANLEYKFIDGLVVIRQKILPNEFVKPLNNFTNFKGVVLDSTSGQPLPFASVFFDNSSYGITTDSLGNFFLSKVPNELHRLVVSYVGYRTLITSVTLKAGADLQMIIRLRPITRQLTDVVVTGKRDKTGADDLELFKTEILGKTVNARLCIIRNPEVIQLKRTKHYICVGTRDVSTPAMGMRTIELKKAYYVLTASTHAPLEIDNRALGYRIKVLIEEFRSYPDSSSFLFYVHYDTLQPSSESERFRWELNRLNAYSGSQMHLFRSILNHQIEEEGFEVCKQKGNELFMLQNGKVKLQPYYENFTVKKTGLGNETCREPTVISKGQYLVRYYRTLTHENFEELPFPSSLIGVNHSLSIDANGFPITSANYWRSGYFDEQRIADMLPNDYNEVKSRAKVVKYEAAKVGNITVVVIDGATRKPVKNVLAFINRSTINLRSNDAGKIFFRNVPIGSQEVVFFKQGYGLAHCTFVSSSISRTDTIRLVDDHFSELDEVPEKSRRSYLPKFQEQVFGGLSENRRIENPDAIRITKISEDSAFFWSLSPIKIVDRGLGYRINFFLDDPGFCYFEDLMGEQEDIGLEARRLAAYDGSFLNFSRSLIDGRVSEEGFRLYKSAGLHKKRKNQKAELNLENLKLDNGSSGLMIKFPYAIEIDYRLPNAGKSRISTLVTNQKRVPITNYGTGSPLESWQVKGDMEEKGLLPKLPINFRPFKGTLLCPF